MSHPTPLHPHWRHSLPALPSWSQRDLSKDEPQMKEGSVQGPLQLAQGWAQGSVVQLWQRTHASHFLLGSKVPRRRQWQPTPVLLPGKSHGRRSLVGCSPWGHEESDMTERLHFHFSLSCIGEGNGNHSSVLAWRIPGMGEPGGLPSMGSHRVGHNWSDLAAAAAVKFHRARNSGTSRVSLSPFSKEVICQYVTPSSLENETAPHSSILAWKVSQRGAWWAAVHRVAKSWAWLSD